MRDKVRLHLNTERLQGPGKKIKALRFGHFEVLEKVVDNVYKLSIPPYMHIYSVVNQEPSMLNQEPKKVLSYVENLELEVKEGLV